MRIHEIFPPIQSLAPDPIEEDLKSFRDKALAAAMAGSLAMGVAHVGRTQDLPSNGSVTVPLDEPDDGKALSEDARFLALTMWGEARNGGEEGMRAVGHVIMNRLDSQRDFGSNVREVVRHRKHFSCWNHGDPNRDLMLHIGKLSKESTDYKMWKTAQHLAKKILAGTDSDPTNGALFYHTKDTDATWDDGQDPVADIAGHLFYKTDAKA